MTTIEKNGCCKEATAKEIEKCERHSLNTKTTYETISENVERIGSKTLAQADKDLLEFYAGDTKTEIKIVPSGRIDYCGDCKTDHGYECPKDTKTGDWEKECLDGASWTQEGNALHRKIKDLLRETHAQLLNELIAEVEGKEKLLACFPGSPYTLKWKEGYNKALEDLKSLLENKRNEI